MSSSSMCENPESETPESNETMPPKPPVVTRLTAVWIQKEKQDPIVKQQ